MKAKKIFVTCFCILFFACGSKVESIGGAENENIEDSVAKTEVSPGVIFESSVLSIQFPSGVKHPSNFAIRNPEGKAIFLVFDDANYQYIPKDRFINETKFEFLVSEMKGVIWSEGKEMIVRVFDVEGEYELWFADNRETEPENTFFIMRKVLYKGGAN
jgi:hypothetical protein